MNLVIDSELKRRFKLACVSDGVHMSEVVSKLVQEWLNEREQQQTSQQRGGKS